MNEALSIFTLDFVGRFAIHFLTLLLFLRVIYYKHTPDRNALFGFSIFGYGVYLVTALLHDVDMSMGFAFGLFAVFSMLRYRTESISIRDMTYLFTVIVLSLLAAVGPVTMIELAILNATICLLTFIAETSLFAPKFLEKKITYEKIENVSPQRHSELLADLRERTGLDITTIAVGRIDYLRDTAEIKIFYKEPETNSAADF